MGRFPVEPIDEERLYLALRASEAVHKKSAGERNETLKSILQTNDL